MLTRNSIPVTLSSKTKDKITISGYEWKLKEYIAKRPILQEMLKGVLQAEGI